MRHSLVVVPHIRGIFAAENPDGARSELLWKASKMDFREVWWKAPIPSMDSKVSGTTRIGMACTPLLSSWHIVEPWFVPLLGGRCRQ